MLKSFFILVSLVLTLFAQIKEINIFPSSYNPSDISGINILDAKEISFKPLNRIEFIEISALAYDKKRGLYALSDRGNLFRLDLEIEDKKIKILSLEEAMPLRTKKGKMLKKKKRDSEGMALGENGLIISFEGHPKVSLYGFHGKKIKNYDLAKALQDRNSYQKKNKALESVINHPVFGIITAPEAPLKGENKGVHTLYSLDETWRFKASGDITSIELMPDNNLLILERDFHLFRGHTITLKKINIMECEKGLCPSRSLASIKSTQGWKLDNFEGLTHIKKNTYLMISDDNEVFFQNCFMVLFEVKN